MVDNDTAVQDYSAVCRTCLQSNGEMENLSALISDNYGTGDIQVTYMECLRYCMPVQDVDVNMPTKICKDCASALQVAYWFTKNACKAQELLKARLKELQEKRKQLERQAFAEALKKPKRYRCKICNAKLETKRSLKDHVKLHLDIIIYSCQMCPYENHKRNYLIEHYQLVHCIEASPEQLKPKAKTAPSTNFRSASTSTAASFSTAHDYTEDTEQHQQLLEHQHQQQQQQQLCDTYMDQSQDMSEVYTSTTPLQHNSEFIYTTSNTNSITSSLALPLEGNTPTTAIFTQPNGETFTFNTFDSSDLNVQNVHNVQNDVNVGNEFIVMADGTVQDAMGRGVVILQSADDGSLALQNGLVLENLIQVPNAETANMMLAQNDIVQMDVDDLIVEDPQNSPEQDVPPPLDEDLIPATIIKKINCKICTKDFDSQGELKNHMLTHSDIPHFFCDRCPFYTFFKIDLHQHYKSKHNLQPTNKQLQPRNKQRAATGTPFHNETENQRKNVVVQRIERFARSPRMVYYCDICFYECDLKYEIKRHYSIKHKIQATEVHQRVSKQWGETSQIQPKKTLQTDQQNNAIIRIQSEQLGPPDYPNGLNCRKCNEIFYWRNELYEHYKMHNAEEMAVKQQQLQQKTQKSSATASVSASASLQTVTAIQQIATELQQPKIEMQQTQIELQQQPIAETQQQQQQIVDVQQVQTAEHDNSQTQFQQHQEPYIATTTSLESSMQSFENVDAMSLNFTPNQSINNPAPLTPSSSSTYTLPSDAIPQIVEMEQTIETDMDFDFNGDALFEDFDDVDVENESDDNDMRNIVLTSDDDYEDMAKNQNEEDGQQETESSETGSSAFCAQCQKSFLSHYQFENHMFLHRGLAPYRCEMCTNLYNTKRALIRHYKAIHKKVPSRDMIQAKGDKVYIYDKTPMDYLCIEESKSITLMCAKCTYESIDFPSVQLHLNTNHSIHEDTYILRKLPFECPRCIRSFASKSKLLRHLERNHSTTPINLHQIQINSSNTATTTTTTTTAPSLNNNVNMMQMNAECDQEQQESHSNSSIEDSDNKFPVRNCVAASTVMPNFYDEDKTIAFDAFNSKSIVKIETSDSYNSHGIEGVDTSNTFNRNLIKIEESNISNCNLLRNEEPNSYSASKVSDPVIPLAQRKSNSNTSTEEDNKLLVGSLNVMSNLYDKEKATIDTNKKSIIKIENTDSYNCHDMESIGTSNTFDRNLIKIEESNITNCNLFRNESAADTVKPVVLYKCQQCDATCSSLESVVVHGKRLKCIGLHKLSKKENPLFKCELCQCKYKTLNLLTMHLKRHIARKYRCTHCPKTYVGQMELEYHQRCHRDERPHQCDLCPNSFRYVHHLKRHKDIIHFGKRHTCPESNCTRQFTTLDQLKIHKWSHYGIVPYKCKYCERLFKKRFLLRDHCLKIHNIHLTETEVAEIFRNNLGYSSPHDMTVAVADGSMLRRDEWESLPYSLQ